MKARLRSFRLAPWVTLLGVACAHTGAPPGELVLVVSTDMAIPKDIDTVRVQVLSRDQVVNDATYALGGANGLLLPATLGILAGKDASLPTTIRVIGIGQHKAVTFREAVVDVPSDRTATLRMPIEWLCMGSARDPNAVDPTTDPISSTCSAGQTCIAGGCTSDSVDATRLPTYASDQIVPAAGDGPTCFDTVGCFAHAVPTTLDVATCTLPLPAGADPSHLNVALEPADGAGICAGNRCYVPLDGDSPDGWSLSGSLVSLPPGLCTALQSTAQATVQISTACPSKTPSVPTCGSWSRGGAGSTAGSDGGLDGGFSDGAESTDANAAPESAALDAGSACAADATRCSGNTVQKCDEAGAWADATPCSSDQTCVGAACVATVTTTATSCATGNGSGLSNCGPAQESCCASVAVPAGSATPSCASGAVQTTGARLDKYEATVGRFRQFVAATNGGWLPAAGAGKHSHLNQGRGLVDTEDGGATYETGWDSSWNSPLTTSLDALSTYSSTGTWTSSPGANENLPMVQLTWYEAYAFCIWDGGFLPSTSEWQVAASGSEGRAYPWSTPPSSMTVDCSYADYFGGPSGTSCVPTGGDTVNICQGTGCQTKPTNPNNVGSESPKGDGKWGHADMAGNAVEWNIDAWRTLGACTDCANLGVDSAQRNQGGGFLDPAPGLAVSNCQGAQPTTNGLELGVRCARAP